MKTLVIVLAALACFPAAQAPVEGQVVQVIAPSWHTGQSWSVQTPLLQGGVALGRLGGGAEAPLRDSPTQFTTYKFQVLGRRTLRYEEQDGSVHIGQAVPPENCWLIGVTPSPQSSAYPVTSYHLYFRADDLSLREVHLILRNGRGGYFMYSGTRVNNDDEAKAALMVDRGPYCSSMEPFLMDWPHFPLTTGGDDAGKKPLLHEAVTQTGTAKGAGIRVALQTGRETATQTWLPGDPWWRFAERDGLRKSRLLRDEQQPSHQVK